MHLIPSDACVRNCTVRGGEGLRRGESEGFTQTPVDVFKSTNVFIALHGERIFLQNAKMRIRSNPSVPNVRVI